MRASLTALALTAVLAVTACSPGGPSTGGKPAAGEPVAIATTTQLGSVLADITACAGTNSATLMPPGVDPHDFALASNEVAKLRKAKLVVANGLGLESGIATALANVESDGGKVFEVGEVVGPLSLGEYPEIGTTPSPDPDHKPSTKPGHEGHHHNDADPHFWLDGARMAKAASAMGAKLAEVTSEPRYTECGAKVAKDLSAVDEQVKAILKDVPADKRILVTDHEAFAYFAQAYGFTVVGVAIPGGSTDAAPSSATLAQIIATVNEVKVSAIFSNASANSKLAEAIKADSGGKVSVVRLSVDSLGAPGSGSDTYSTMMLSNAKAIAAALKG